MRKILITYLLMTLLPLFSAFSQEDTPENLLTNKTEKVINKLEEEINNYSDLIKTEQDTTQLKNYFFERGKAFDQAGLYDKAILDYTSAIKLDSTDTKNFLYRGYANMHNGFNHRALNDFNYIVNQDNGDKVMMSALYWLAVTSYDSSDFKSTVDYCDRIIGVNDRIIEVYSLRAMANEWMYQYWDAYDDYSRIIELSPRSAIAYTNRATTKINILTKGGVRRTCKRETLGLCEDLKKALEFGNEEAKDIMVIYCDEIPDCK